MSTSRRRRRQKITSYRWMRKRLAAFIVSIRHVGRSRTTGRRTHRDRPFGRPAADQCYLRPDIIAHRQAGAPSFTAHSSRPRWRLPRCTPHLTSSQSATSVLASRVAEGHPPRRLRPIAVLPSCVVTSSVSFAGRRVQRVQRVRRGQRGDTFLSVPPAVRHRPLIGAAASLSRTRRTTRR